MSRPQVAARAAIPLLTSLRFFAASLVVADHYFESDRKDWVGVLTGSGYECVVFFFVLSGFILTYVYTDSAKASGMTTTASQFWKARFARIAPAYLLALAIGLPLFAYGALVSHIIPTKLFVAGLILTPLCLQTWWSPAAFLWNAPAWSLSVEALFYAAFPFITRRSQIPLAWAATLALAFLAATAVVVFMLTPASMDDTNAWVFRNHFPPFHLAEFTFGMILGRIFLSATRLSKRTYGLLFVAGVLSVAGLLSLQYVLPTWAFNNATLALTFGLMIYGAAGLGSVRVLAGPAMVLLGEASYALYILHMPLMFWWLRAAPMVALPAGSAAGFALYFAGMTALSVAVLLFWENPWRRRILRGVRLWPAPRRHLA